MINRRKNTTDETSNTCSNGIIYIPNGDGTYSELGVIEDIDEICVSNSYSEIEDSGEHISFNLDDEYNLTATITDSTGFEEWLAKWQELWNRQCMFDILLAAELYDIDGISQDGYTEMKPVVKESESELSTEDSESNFDSDEERKEFEELLRKEKIMLEVWCHCALMAYQLYDIDGSVVE